jgi:hypothetical protein
MFLIVSCPDVGAIENGAWHGKAERQNNLKNVEKAPLLFLECMFRIR